MIDNLNIELQKLQVQYYSNIDSVKELASFDDLILQLAITQLRNLEEKLTSNFPLIHINQIQITRTALEQIETNGSLASNYQKMYNQCLVLLMSYFSSGIKELVSLFISTGIKYDLFESLREIEFKFLLPDIQKISAGEQSLLTDYILTSQNVSFQDMKSIKRLVKKYFDVEIERDQTVNNIITALACRHSIVHAAAKIESQFMNQIRDCNPRTLKLEITLGDTVAFSKDELTLVSCDVKNYYDNLLQNIRNIFQAKWDSRGADA